MRPSQRTPALSGMDASAIRAAMGNVDAANELLGAGADTQVVNTLIRRPRRRDDVVALELKVIDLLGEGQTDDRVRPNDGSLLHARLASSRQARSDATWWSQWEGRCKEAPAGAPAYRSLVRGTRSPSKLATSSSSSVSRQNIATTIVVLRYTY